MSDTSGQASGEPTPFSAPIHGRFEVVRSLGAGGAATVYLANDRTTGNQVAIKVLRPEIARLVGTARFLREIEISKRVHHPLLVSLIDAGEVDGIPFFVMPCYPEGSLRDRLRSEGQLSLPDALRLGRDLLDAMECLHAAGVFHRDIKPENVLLDGNRALLADFGIARAISASATEELTSAGFVLGTPAYMSPEQGTAGAAIDSRSDLYSWGCVVYEALVGVTPFAGGSAQVVVARQMHEPPPSIRVARSSVPPSLETLVLATLAKAPADRPRNAAEARAALDAVRLDEPSVITQRTRAPARRRRLALAGGIALALALVLTARFLIPTPALDLNRIVVFPLDGTAGGAEGEGQRVAWFIGSALERTEPLRWIDGASVGGPGRSAGPIRVAEGRQIARAQRAGYFLLGTLTRSSDSTRVALQLFDARRGTLVAQETAGGRPDAQATDIAVPALVRLLVPITQVPRVSDIARFQARPPGAVANWLQGEHDYRRSRITEALDLFQRALAGDSMLAPAALRGAMAASWVNRPGDARVLIRLAIARDSLLSPRQRLLSRAILHYVEGEADSTMLVLRRAIAQDPEWIDAWFLAGEVQLHLLPAVTLDSTYLLEVPPRLDWPLERFAEEAFERVRQLDPGFAPPLSHLAEIALRRGQIARADSLLATLRRMDADTANVRRLGLMVACLRDGPDRDRWSTRTAGTRTLFEIGELLAAATAPAPSRCAASALHAVLAADTSAGVEDWGALVYLQGMLVAGGRAREAVGLLDSAVASGMPAALGLIVLDGVAGVDVGTRADGFLRGLRDNLETRGPPSLWLLGCWAAARGDLDLLTGAARAARGLARRDGSRLAVLIASALDGHESLIRGDSAAALRRLQAVRPSAPREALEGSLWEPLGFERLQLARLQLARGDPVGALRTASVFDHPSMVTVRVFLPASLALRAAAAERLGNGSMAKAFRERISTDVR